MKGTMLMICLLVVTTGFGQTNTDVLKEYLGVLTLSEKYRDEANWDKEAQGTVQQHFVRLQEMKKKGIVSLAGRTQYETSDPDMMGLVIFKAKNDEEARQFMQDDPAVKAKIMLAKVHPYATAISKCE
ncbi:MAG TPA: YciI family protein [Chitinophagaceae bacterium]|nr:YciI family protein [Chitinophagaceae bacterium]